MTEEEKYEAIIEKMADAILNVANKKVVNEVAALSFAEAAYDVLFPSKREEFSHFMDGARGIPYGPHAIDRARERFYNAAARRAIVQREIEAQLQDAPLTEFQSGRMQEAANAESVAFDEWQALIKRCK